MRQKLTITCKKKIPGYLLKQYINILGLLSYFCPEELYEKLEENFANIDLDNTPDESQFISHMESHKVIWQ